MAVIDVHTHMLSETWISLLSQDAWPGRIRWVDSLRPATAAAVRGGDAERIFKL
jgi:hypothetical protein